MKFVVTIFLIIFMQSCATKLDRVNNGADEFKNPYPREGAVGKAKAPFFKTPMGGAVLGAMRAASPAFRKAFDEAEERRYQRKARKQEQEDRKYMLAGRKQEEEDRKYMLAGRKRTLKERREEDVAQVMNGLSVHIGTPDEEDAFNKSLGIAVRTGLLTEEVADELSRKYFEKETPEEKTTFLKNMVSEYNAYAASPGEYSKAKRLEAEAEAKVKARELLVRNRGIAKELEDRRDILLRSY